MEQGFHLVQVDKFVNVLNALELTPNDVLIVEGGDSARPRSSLEEEIDILYRNGTPLSTVMQRIAEQFKALEGKRMAKAK